MVGRSPLSLLCLILAAAAAFAVVAVAFEMTGQLALLEDGLYDLALAVRPAPPASNEIVLVEVDKVSLEAKELGKFPWSRSVHATLIRRLLKAGAALVGFDMIFPRKSTDPAADADLLAAIREGEGKVVMGHLETQGNFLEPGLDGIPLGDVTYPYERRQRDKRVRSFAVQTLDGKIREGYPYPIAYELARRRLGITAPPRRQGEWITDGRLRIPAEPLSWERRDDPNLHGRILFAEILEKPEGRVGCGRKTFDYPCFSYYDVYAGKIPSEEFKGKIVIVLSDFDQHDKFDIPNQKEINGGEIHAALLQMFLESRFLRHHHLAERLLLGTTFLGSFMVSLRLRKRVWRGVGFIGLGMVVLLCHLLLMKGDGWVNVALPLLAIPVNWGVVYGFEHRKVRGLLARFVPRRVYDLLLESEETKEAGTVVEEATILFSDIRGYTTLSEKMEPGDLREFMNEYHAAMVGIFKRCGGEIMYYQGDAQMVAFRESDQLGGSFRHADRAVYAGLLMQERLAELNAGWERVGRAPIRIGVGITTGKAAFGLVGEDRLTYTALGDVVNTAARLQALSAELDAPVLLDPATYEEVRRSIAAEELAPVALKGKSGQMKVYKVTGWNGPIPAEEEAS